METRANYVLIGAFALAGFLAILAFFLWFAQINLDRRFAYYDINFPTVSGLSNASDVRFGGFPVGKVVDVKLAPDGSGQIRVRIEVASETPVRTGTIATIESQGVTGVSFVGLTAGEPDEPLLRDVAGRAAPTITSGRSALQRLSEDAPEIVEEALAVAQQLRDILGPENQARITAILANLETSSTNIDKVMGDFSSVTDNVARASEHIATFSQRLEPMSSAATIALETADVTLKQITSLAARSEETLAVAEGALDSGRRVFDRTDLFIAETLPGLITDLNETTARFRVQIDLVGNDARAMMEDLRSTGSIASARLTEIEKTIKATDEMLASMTASLATFDSASRSFEALVEGEGTALVAETRAMVANAERVIASATTVAETDLPAIVADIRSATQTASRVVEEVGANLSAATGRIDGLSDAASAALTTVTDTFTRANETLAGLNSAIETGDRALAAADRAFTSADRIMGEDVDAIFASLRDTLGRLDEAMAQVSADLPVMTSELRETAERANTAIGQIQAAVADASPKVQEFAREGLPQYTRLAREAQSLVESLGQLARRIERDPARYLLGRDAPEFRR